MKVLYALEVLQVVKLALDSAVNRFDTAVTFAFFDAFWGQSVLVEYPAYGLIFTWGIRCSLASPICFTDTFDKKEGIS